MHRDGPLRRQRSGSRDRGCRDDRECRSDGRGSHHEDRGGRRPGARDRMPDRSQFDDRRDGSGGRACRGPRSGNDDGRGYGGAPRPTDGRQVEGQARYYDSQAFQHQSRPEAMGVRDSGVRRVESPRRHAEPWEWPHRDEPQRRYEEPSRQHGEPQRRYDEPSRQHGEPQQ